MPYEVFQIKDPKLRTICAASFRDRIAHHAVCNILEPIFEKMAIEHSYACRKGKGSHRAILQAQIYIRNNNYYLKCDIKKYFESVDHEILKKLLRRTIKDKDLLKLLDKIIDHAVPGAALLKGLPIGNLTSQHFANLYLGELDHFLKDRNSVKSYIRYMDDFLIFSKNKENLHLILNEIRKFLEDNLKLQLKEKVVKIAPVTEGVPFLGMRIFRNLIRLQRPNLVRFLKKMKRNERKFHLGKISEEDLFNSANSMTAHISHANTLALRRKICFINYWA